MRIAELAEDFLTQDQSHGENMSPQAAKARHIEKSIPALLRARRKQMGLTLQELADKAGLSPAFVSQAERGKAVPSIVSLIQLAGALETDINYFVTPPETNSLVRRAADPIKVEIDSPVTYHRLDGDVRNRLINALRMVIPPKTELPTVHREEGEDFFFVLKGEIRVDVGDEVFDLKEGDCVHINSQLEHDTINMSEEEVHVLWVGTPAIFEN
ncbi:MAG: cupin domain-containing protein [Gammaproteobacteria bacterium]|nr:cupin domain-containing protein [Gammaproteobacteria bacterium]